MFRGKLSVIAASNDRLTMVGVILLVLIWIVRERDNGKEFCERKYHKL